MAGASSRRGQRKVACVEVSKDANPCAVFLAVIWWPFGTLFGAIGSQYSKFTKTRFGSAIDREKGATFNFIAAHVLWWAIGFPVADEHGYNNELINGAAPHGSQGSGVYPLTLFLCIMATVLWIVKIAVKYNEGVPESVEDIITKKTTLAKGNPKAANALELSHLHRSGSFNLGDKKAEAEHKARAEQLEKEAAQA